MPLIAVQPASLPPHTAASMAAAYAALYGRPLHFNLVAGARDDELRRTGDLLGHDERYERMRAYGRVLRALLNGEEVTEEGEHYRYRKFRLEPRPEVLSRCLLFVAGSSPPASPSPGTSPTSWSRIPRRTRSGSGTSSSRCGPTATRGASASASVSSPARRARTPGRRPAPASRDLARPPGDAAEDRVAERLVAAAGDPGGGGGGGRGRLRRPGRPVLAGAFRTGRASAPFLVGSHEEVGSRLGEYLRAGVEHVLLNGSYEDDHEDINAAVRAARRHRDAAASADRTGRSRPAGPRRDRHVHEGKRSESGSAQRSAHQGAGALVVAALLAGAGRVRHRLVETVGPAAGHLRRGGDRGPGGAGGAVRGAAHRLRARSRQPPRPGGLRRGRFPAPGVRRGHRDAGGVPRDRRPPADRRIRLHATAVERTAVHPGRSGPVAELRLRAHHHGRVRAAESAGAVPRALRGPRGAAARHPAPGPAGEGGAGGARRRRERARLPAANGPTRSRTRPRWCRRRWCRRWRPSRRARGS
ncbi:LLM class flavin-dependent oxidoreductase [Streptomyces sp. M19]